MTSRLQASVFLQPHIPFRPNRWPFFYGWVILAMSMVGMFMSIPGQTAGVSIFIDHLIEATGLSRFGLSNAYLVGTLTSGLLLPWGGLFLDRVGARLTGMLAAGGLAVTLCYFSYCDRISLTLATHLSIAPTTTAMVVLILGFICLRFCGQGMLTLTSRTTLGRWFDRKRGLAAGILGVFVSFSFGGAPLMLSAWVSVTGWRGAWLGMALGIGLGMGLLSWLFIRERPEDCGLHMDGVAVIPTPRTPDIATVPNPTAGTEDFTRGEAIRTLAFWATTLAISTMSLTVTGITFHVVDIGATLGLSETASVAWFLPVAIASTFTGLGMGIASDRLPLKGLYIAMMIAQILAILGVAHLNNTVGYWAAIIGLGFCVGCFETLGSVTLPRYFGCTHLGAIFGVQMMSLVISSAIGPVFLALFRSWLGSYQMGLYICSLLPLSMIGVLLLMQTPKKLI